MVPPQGCNGSVATCFNLPTISGNRRCCLTPPALRRELSLFPRRSPRGPAPVLHLAIEYPTSVGLCLFVNNETDRIVASGFLLHRLVAASNNFFDADDFPERLPTILHGGYHPKIGSQTHRGDAETQRETGRGRVVLVFLGLTTRVIEEQLPDIQMLQTNHREMLTDACSYGKSSASQRLCGGFYRCFSDHEILGSD